MTTGIKLLVIFAAGVLAWVIAGIIGIVIESKLYNKGICLTCSQPLEFFDFDSRGGRGYKCPLCGDKIWVSYDRVDKYWDKIREETKEKTNK